MTFAAAVTSLIGIVGFLGQEGLINITDPGVLCSRYGSLVLSNSSVFTSSNVTKFQNGSSIPQLCNTTSNALKNMTGRVLIYKKLMGPFSTLPGFNIQLQTFFATLPTSDGTVDEESKLMSVMMRSHMLKTALEINNHTYGGLGEKIIKMVLAAGKIVVHCTSAIPGNTTTDPLVQQLFLNTSLSTFCKSTNISQIRTALNTLRNSSGADLREMDNLLPMISFIVRVMNPVKDLSGFNSTLRQLADGLAPLDIPGMSAEDPRLVGLLINSNIQRSIQILADQSVLKSIMGLLPAVDGLATYCSHNVTPPISNFPLLQNLVHPAVKYECQTNGLGNDFALLKYRNETKGLASIFTKAFVQSTEFLTLQQMIPKLIMILKLLQPYQDQPGVDQSLSILMRSLKGVSEKEVDDPMLYLMLMHPDVLNAMTTLGSAAMQPKISDIVSGLGVLDQMCGSSDNQSTLQATLDLMKDSNFSTVCTNTDMNTIMNNLNNMNALIAQHGNGSGNTAQEYIARIPRVQLALKVITPFLELQAFDRDLRNVSMILSPAASVDTTNMNALAGMLSTPGMTLAIQRIETATYQKKLAAAIKGIAGLNVACRQPPMFSKVRNLIVNSTVTQACKTAQQPLKYMKQLHTMQDNIINNLPTTQAPNQNVTIENAGIVNKGSLFHQTLVSLLAILFLIM